MPILNVEIVGEEQDFAQNLAQQIADAAGEVLESRPQGTWVRLSYLSARNYAENTGADPTVTPVFVSVILSEVPETQVLRTRVSSLARAIASVLSANPENVHILIEPPAKGRIAFGGKLVE